MFQGNGSVPGDGPDGPVAEAVADTAVDPTGELRPNRASDTDNLTTTASIGVMTLTASRVGDTVTFKAAADDDPTDATAAMELINFEATAGADGMTSGMDEVDLPGQTKHIYLMSDIEAPSTGSFANNKPEGLTLPDPAATDPEYRYGVDANWFHTTTEAGVETANRPIAITDTDRRGSSPQSRQARQHCP